MAWVVDTCLLLDVLEEDPLFGMASAKLLDRKTADELVICPVSYIELAPAFLGDVARQNDFLAGVGVRFHVHWSWEDILAAHRAWQHHIAARRSTAIPRRPIADVLIGAFAARQQGLLTRNTKDFTQLFPDLTVLEP
ncbi:MAG: type II toxin-antitoxin system VapC family toxin [Kiritimatiellaeota bacterium]|nr:type II toxin-antitoxin system VapC family toxin [Kiritimatiellota bacterium]